MKKIILFIIISGIFIILISTKAIKNKNIIKKNTNNFKHIVNFKKKLKYRYSNYYRNNRNLKTEDIVTRVNIGLDKPFYTNTNPTPHLNKIYILVNKYLYLDKTYIPNNLVKTNIDYEL